MKAFWQSMLAAALGGAATTVASAITDPHTISDAKKIGTVAVVGALIGVGGLLKQSPVQTPDAAQKDATKDA